MASQAYKMPPKKQGPARDRRVEHAMEKNSRRVSDFACIWESFVHSTTNFLQEFFELLSVFWIWLHSWRSVLFDSSEQEVLIEWLKTRMPEVPSDFSESWKDGVFLCVLLENLNPGCSPRPDLLDRDQGYRNVSRALEIIERFDLSPGIKADDIVSCTANSDKKLISLLLKLKKKAESFYTRGTNDKGESLHLRRPPPEVQACFAKGTGLAIGFIRRPARFIIFCESMYDLDIVIEIKGPGTIVCCERITLRSPKRKKSNSIQPSYDPKTFKTVRSISVTDSMMEEQAEKSCPLEKFQLEYEIQDDRISVDYIPMVVGEYKVTILWHGQHVPGSPYHVSVEDAYEKFNVNNVIHLRPSLRHTDNSKTTEDSGAQTTKTRKHSVRFKDSEIENKEWGKVIKRKVLRYIVKLNGKEVEVDVDRSDMLAPALLKLDYALENNPTCHRRNSWGFVGDVERKKSMVRQFCVDLEDKEMCGMQRRSSSFHLAYSNDQPRIFFKEGDYNANTKLTNLKTVSEGTDKGFRSIDGTKDLTSDYYETFDSMDEISSFDNGSISQSPVLKIEAVAEELISESPLQGNFPNEIKFKINNEPNAVQHDYPIEEKQSDNSILASSLDQKKVNNTMISTNADQEMEIKNSNAAIIKVQGDSINNGKAPLRRQRHLEILSNFENDLPNKNYIQKNGVLDKKHSNWQHGVENMHRIKIHGDGYSLKIKRKKSLSPKIAVNGKIRRNKHMHKEKNRGAINKTAIRKPQIRAQCKVVGKSLSQNKLKQYNEKNKSQIETQKFGNIPWDLRTKRYINNASPLRIGSWSSETSLKSPFILQSVIKGNKYENSSSGKKNITTKAYASNEYSIKKRPRTPHAMNISNYADKSPFNSFGTIPTNFFNNSEHLLLKDYKLSNSSSIKSYTEDFQKDDPFADRSSYSVNRHSNLHKDVPKTSGHFHVPAFTFQHFRNRGKSFSRLSLGQSVKDIVKDFENNGFSDQNDDMTNGKNFYSRSLNFPPLAANEDRIRVKNRIMQWETTSSLPSGRSKNYYKRHQDREKLSVLADVHSKTAFWETAYTIKQNGYMDKNERTYNNKKVRDISKSDTGVYPIVDQVHRNQTKDPDEDSLQQNEFNNNEICGEKSSAHCMTLKVKKSYNKNRCLQKINLSRLEDRRASDPGPTIRTSSSKSQFPWKWSLSNNDLRSVGSLWSIGALSSSATFSYFDHKEDAGDGYIDDEIPDYAAMFWDDYISDAGLLFDSRKNCFKPNSDEVKVYGGGVYYGHVSVKNHFQVLTKGAGKGHLSVSVQGSSLHDVTNVSVIYSRRDIYIVTYQVIEPGYYLISVRWSDIAVPGSPFVCKVTY